VRFTDFLKSTVVLTAGVATALAAITVLSAAAASHHVLIAAMGGWWVLAGVVGIGLGRRAEASPPIARLLAAARSSSTLPLVQPARILANRLWPLLLFALIAGGLGFLAAQIPGIGAGFAIIWALAWRRQHDAVRAIEERDGVRFYVLPTSPIRPIELQRTPGMKAIRYDRSAAA
jgi:hypothetical protein